MIRDTISDFLDDSPFQLAAALSFYTLLSLSPLVLVVVGVAGLVWKEDVVRAELLGQLERLVGPAGADTINLVLKAAVPPERGLTSILTGIATLLIGATGVFAQLQTALNQMWNVKASPDRHAIWGLLRTRLLAVALVLVLGFLLLVSLVASAALAALHGHLSAVFPAGGVVWQLVNFVVSLVVIAFLIAAIFKVLPDAQIGWPEVWFGGLFTSILFGIGKFFIGLYLGHAGLSSAYGAAGSLVVFLVWIYYSSLIFLLGAEVTQVYARKVGRPIRPAPHAVAVSRE